MENFILPLGFLGEDGSENNIRRYIVHFQSCYIKKSSETCQLTAKIEYCFEVTE